MMPQQKVGWFWSIAELLGTMFDEVHERKRKVSERARDRQAKRPQPRSRKRHEETSTQNGARVVLKQSN